MAQEPATTVYPAAPELDLAPRPKRLSTLEAGQLGSDVKRNFARRAQWCADGSAALVTTEDRLLRLYDTSNEIAMSTFDRPAQTYNLSDAIVSTAWYPSASIKTTPEAFCFAAAVRDSPIKLIDGFTGAVRATYPIIDHRERVIAPHSMVFNPNGTSLLCGHDSAIEVFDITRPGDEGERIKTSRTRKEKGGLKGIVSALAYCTDFSGLYAAGTFSGQVALYMEDANHPVSHLEGVVGGGVTQLVFHPLTPQTLFIASRRSDVVQVYDTRDTSQPLLELPRQGMTNQRIWFDVDPWGRWLVSGDTDGQVSFWDIQNLGDGQPRHVHKLHHDVVGSVQLHPFQPLLLIASGSRDLELRHKQSRLDSDSDTETDSTDSDHEEVDSEGADRNGTGRLGAASVCVWSIGALTTASSGSA